MSMMTKAPSVDSRANNVGKDNRDPMVQVTKFVGSCHFLSVGVSLYVKPAHLFAG
jgi:hypothetical protein